MARFQTVDLSPYRFSVRQVDFLRAEVPSAPSPFALIRYSVNGVEQREALRLDLHKRSFLDQPAVGGGIGFREAAPMIADALREAFPSR